MTSVTIHLVLAIGDSDVADIRVRAVCGDEALITWPDAHVLPDYFDFVLSPDPHGIADCIRCLTASAAIAKQKERAV